MKAIKVIIAALMMVMLLLPSLSAFAGTSDIGAVTGAPTDARMSIKTFYANGRHWAFFPDGTNTVWATSTDGAAWGATAIAIAGFTDSSGFAVQVDSSNNVHLASYVGNDLTYRHGACNADGTITWTSAANTITDPTASVGNISIALESGGNPWIFYGDNLAAADFFPCAIRSDNLTGGWNTTAGFPKQLDTTAQANAANSPSMGVPFGTGMYAFYGTVTDTSVHGMLYSAGAWGAEDTWATDADTNAWFTASGDANKLYCAWPQGMFLKFRSGVTGTLDATSTVMTSVVSGPRPRLMTDRTHNVTYLASLNYLAANHVYIRAYYNGAWLYDWQDWITEADTLTSAARWNANPTITNGYASMIWQSKAGTPWDATYGYLKQPVVTTDNVSFSISKDGVMTGYFGFTLSDNGTAPALTNAVGYGTLSDATAPYVYAYTAYATDNNSTTGYKQTNVFSLSSISPGFTYYYRAGSDFRGWGNEGSFTTSVPTVSTVSASNSGSTVTLTGNVTSLGSCSGLYTYFEYGTTTAYGHNTSTSASVTATGTYTANLTHPDYPKDLHYRAVIVTGTSTYYGSDMTLSTSTAAKDFNIDKILQFMPLLVLAALLMSSGVLTIDGIRKKNTVEAAIGLCFIAVVLLMFPIIIDAIEDVLAFIP